MGIQVGTHPLNGYGPIGYTGRVPGYEMKGANPYSPSTSRTNFTYQVPLKKTVVNVSAVSSTDLVVGTQLIKLRHVGLV